MRARIELACAALLVLVVYLIGIGDTLADTDEVIYAEFIRAMHRTGDYFTLRWEGAPAHQRPSAPVAMYAVVSAVIPGEIGMRLLPVLLSALSAVACGLVVWRRSGSVEAACATMWLCAGVVSYFTYGRLLFSDPPFVLAVVGSIAATMAAQHDPKWLVWAAASLGAAFAMKSFAAAVPAIALGPWMLVAILKHRGDARLRVGWSVVAFIALASPFYIAGLARFGGEFIDVHFGYNLGERAAGIEGIGLSGSLAYVRHVWAVDGPIWFAIVFGAPLGCIVAGARRRDPDLLVPASVAVGSFLILSMVGTRLPHYLLPFYPAAIVCAGMLAARAATWLRARQPLAAWLPATVALALFATSISAPPFDASLMPATEARALARAAAAELEAGEPVYSLDWYTPALGYYTDRPWRLLTTYERMATIVGSVDIFASAQSVTRVPPFPAAPRFIIAGEEPRLRAAPGMTIVRELARQPGHILVEMRASAR